MACSNPLPLRRSDLKESPRTFYSTRDRFELMSLVNSNWTRNYSKIPCGRCLNCRIDKQNELSDRCEYEYIKYGCGAFVTFTFDDIHLNPYSFIDSRDGQLKATLDRKCLKDFLNRLNKHVHKFNREHGLTPFCRPDYKYLAVGEYGENGSQFDRPHFHVLFFGLDYAMCERLFWRSWQFGNIQVGAIRNGGIGYVVSYLDKQFYGFEKFLKYTYHHLEPPFQVHSLGLGEGLYTDQMKYIVEHDGNYHWHGKDRPVPIYYKNKFRITSDLTQESFNRRYNKRKDDILNAYNVKIRNFEELERFNLNSARTLQNIREISMINHGKAFRDEAYISKQYNDLVYGSDKHRLPKLFDKQIVKIVDIFGRPMYKIDHRLKSIKDMTTRDFLKLHTSKNQLYRLYSSTYGISQANKVFDMADVPF